jgi:hypothetical protein
MFCGPGSKKVGIFGGQEPDWTQYRLTVLRKQSWQLCSIMMEWATLRSSTLQMIMLNDWRLGLQRWWWWWS